MGEISQCLFDYDIQGLKSGELRIVHISCELVSVLNYMDSNDEQSLHM